MKSVTLELRGKSPVLIFADADLEKIVPDSAILLVMSGQGCARGTRFSVHESIANEDIKLLKELLDQYTSTLGSGPHDIRTTSGSLFNKRHKEIVMKCIEQGKTESELIYGGQAVGDKGNFVQPTIFFKPKLEAQVSTHEIFGPH